ncbi:hypothetical protein NP493_8g05032 [Ridgeia piscesae]|uniref:Uncharacterized protein n=1 Tax=Ridgeia piscesae TaxID=27915 RepID=A0AAD9ULA2_RIDPI|nr:hypothetical protein NP493_8g05032 [Ridgeia piscesae]
MYETLLVPRLQQLSTRWQPSSCLPIRPLRQLPNTIENAPGTFPTDQPGYHRLFSVHVWLQFVHLFGSFILNANSWYHVS